MTAVRTDVWFWNLLSSAIKQRKQLKVASELRIKGRLCNDPSGDVHTHTTCCAANMPIKRQAVSCLLSLHICTVNIYIHTETLNTCMITRTCIITHISILRFWVKQQRLPFGGVTENWDLREGVLLTGWRAAREATRDSQIINVSQNFKQLKSHLN